VYGTVQPRLGIIPVTPVLRGAATSVRPNTAARRQDNKLANPLFHLAGGVDYLGVNPLASAGAIGPLQLEALATVLVAVGDGKRVAQVIGNRFRLVVGAEECLTGSILVAGTLLALALALGEGVVPPIAHLYGAAGDWKGYLSVESPLNPARKWRR
jgi:hypothetical protein